MDVLSYSPSIALYVETDGGVLDMTDDLVSLSVSRKLDAASSMSAKVSNPKGKYNGLIKPMDRFTAYASKGSPNDRGYRRLITGYVSKVDRFTLYGADMSISGYDALYRLQRLYWDPKLSESVQFLHEAFGGMRTIGATTYADGIRRLVTEVGGMPSDMVLIQNDVPREIASAAYDLYVAQQADYTFLEQVRRDIEAMVRASSLSSGGSSGSSGAGAGTASSEALESAVQHAIQIANDDTHGYSWGRRMGIDYDCSSLIMRCLKEAGFDVDATVNTRGMRSQLEPVGFAWHPYPFAESDLQRGDILLNEINHTCWYIGGGQIVNASQNYDGDDPYGYEEGTEGDSSGREILVRDFYWYPDNKGGWDGYLHYVGD